MADFSDVPLEVTRHVWVTVLRLANEAKERSVTETSLLHRGHWTEAYQWLMSRLESLPGRHYAYVAVPAGIMAGRVYPHPCWCERGEDHESPAAVDAVEVSG